MGNQASTLAAKARGADAVDPVADWQQVYRASRHNILPFLEMDKLDKCINELDMSQIAEN